MSRPNADFMKNRKRLFKALVNNGCYLFPIKKHRKVPKGMWADESTNDWDKILEWVNRGHNIGIDTGKSGLLVIDIDTKHQTAEEIQFDLEMLYGDIPPTFTVKTASGGLHYYFKQPNDLGNTAGGLLTDVDTRGVGGYVVAPGSIVLDKQVIEGLLVDKTFNHPEKGEIEYRDFDYQTLYKENLEWLYYTRESKGKIAFAELPEHYRTKLEETAESPTKGVACEIDEEDVDTDAAVGRGRLYCVSEHPPAVEGEGGDNTTFQLFARLRDMGLTEDTAIELAEEYYNPRCTPEWDFEDLQRIASHAYTYAKEPLGIMSVHADFKSDDEDDIYSEEALQIVIPETGQVINPKLNDKIAPDMTAHEKKTVKKNSKVDRLVAMFPEKPGVAKLISIMGEDRIHNHYTGKIYKRSSFASHYKSLIQGKESAEDAASDIGLLVKVDDREYLPGQELFTMDPRDGSSIVYNSYRPSLIKPVAGDTKVFDRFLERTVPDKEDREVVLDFLAHVVQNPGHKMSFAIVLIGNHGVGKTLLANLMGELVGASNFQSVSAGQVKKDFNGWMMDRRLLLLDECHDIGTLEIANKLKEYIANTIVSVERKGMDVVKAKNFADFILTSNYDDAVRADEGERRYYVINTKTQVRLDSEIKQLCAELWEYINVPQNPDYQAALSAIMHKLMSRDLSNFNPHVLPKQTKAFKQMIKANRSDWQAELDYLIDNKEGTFKYDVFGLRDIIQLLKDAGFTKIRQGTVCTYLKDKGCLYRQDVKYRTKDGYIRDDILVVRNQELWEPILHTRGEGTKILALYCIKFTKGTAREFEPEDDKPVNVHTFVKEAREAVKANDNSKVTPIKK